MLLKVFLVAALLASHVICYESLCFKDLPEMTPITGDPQVYYTKAQYMGLLENSCGNITIDPTTMLIFTGKQFYYPYKDFHEFETKEYMYSKMDNYYISVKDLKKSTREAASKYKVYLHESWSFVFYCMDHVLLDPVLGSTSRLFDKQKTKDMLSFFLDYTQLVKKYNETEFELMENCNTFYEKGGNVGFLWYTLPIVIVFVLLLVFVVSPSRKSANVYPNE